MKTPRYYGLKHDQWRPYQAETIEQIARSTKRVVVVEAPTGSGKSAINLGLLLVTGARGFILTPTKSLQEQYISEASRRAKLIMGKGNYPCVLPTVAKSTRVDKAQCQLPGRKCVYEYTCPYFVKRAAAQRAQISVHNYHYFLHETSFTDADWVIADEGHDIAEVIAEFETIELARKLPDKSELDGHDLVELKEACKEAVDNLGLIEPKNDTEALAIHRVVEQLKQVIRIKSPHTFVEDEHGYKLKPMSPTRPVDALLGMDGERGSRLLITSGTVLDPNMFARANHVEDFEFIRVPTTFKPEQHPIYYLPTADVTYKNKFTAPDLLATAIDSVIASRPEVKGIIHTVSYDLTAAIYSRLTQRNRVLQWEKGNARGVLQRFRTSTDPVWIISPAVARGEDFPYDQARCQVVAKMPYPSMGDPWVAYQMDRAPYWLDYRTMQELWQMCGRVCRAEDDYGETVLLDQQYGQLARRRPGLVAEEVQQIEVFV